MYCADLYSFRQDTQAFQILRIEFCKNPSISKPPFHSFKSDQNLFRNNNLFGTAYLNLQNGA